MRTYSGFYLAHLVFSIRPIEHKDNEVIKLNGVNGVSLDKRMKMTEYIFEV